MKLMLRNSMPSMLADWPVSSSLLGANWFDEFPMKKLGVNVPSVNITETPTEFKLEVAAPGLERKDFNIEVENNFLCISAEKEAEKKEEDEGYTMQEYSFNSFSRTFALPENIKVGNIDAKYENGILKVVMPKAKEDKTKAVQKITVA
jgi:HSP20 family protein